MSRKIEIVLTEEQAKEVYHELHSQWLACHPLQSMVKGIGAVLAQIEAQDAYAAEEDDE